MSIVIGIDIGGSTTKIIGICNDTLIKPMIVTATDQIASLFGAFGKFVDSNALNLADIEHIMITGVGSSYVSRRLYGLPTSKVPEFLANGLGGLYLSGLKRAVIVSMGTGTAIVKANGGTIEYIGGTGVGGGTILGLANKMLNVRDINLIKKIAEDGELHNVDLYVGDITTDSMPGLPSTTTASNFGKISDVATSSDIALGIFNLVFQSIGTTTMFALKATDHRDAVLIGNLSAMPQCACIFEEMGKLYGINYIIPENSEYATAAGAALAYGMPYELTLV